MARSGRSYPPSGRPELGADRSRLPCLLADVRQLEPVRPRRRLDLPQHAVQHPANADLGALPDSIMQGWKNDAGSSLNETGLAQAVMLAQAYGAEVEGWRRVYTSDLSRASVVRRSSLSSACLCRSSS